MRAAERRLAVIAGGAAGAGSIGGLRRDRATARALRNAADAVVRAADARLVLPLIGSQAMDQPVHTEWAWRPAIWRLPQAVPGLARPASGATLGSELALYHDCPLAEIALRQMRNSREQDLAPFGLCLDVLGFRGSYFSMVLTLPPAAIAGLKRRHLVRLSAQVSCDRPAEIFARLNVKHGPNTEQIVRELPAGQTEVAVDFDLAYSNLNEKRTERAWLDLIFEAPAHSQIKLHDITVSRRPRAEV